jgi:hypothetical protein
MYYISNDSDGPLIEFDRSDVPENKCGRLYWAKYFAAPNGLSYDVDKFSKWYDTLVRWIKKNSAGTTKYVNWVTYYLPDAWREYDELSRENSDAIQ